MIHGFVSKRGGCGRTTLSLSSALMSSKDKSNSILYIDLGKENNIEDLFKIKNSGSSIDNLISEVVLKRDLSIDKNVVDIGTFYVIPGSKVKSSDYLIKKYLDLSKILKELESRFNIIIVEMDYDLFKKLQGAGVNINPVFILSQSISSIAAFRKDFMSTSKNRNVSYAINMYRNGVFPTIDIFASTINNDLVCVDYDDKILSDFNLGNLEYSRLIKSKGKDGLLKLSKIIVDNQTIIEKPYRKKRTLFSKIFDTEDKIKREANVLPLVKEAK